MHSQILRFCILLSFSASLASVLLPNFTTTTRPSNNIHRGAAPDNITLGAWPPHLPWTMPLGGDLSMDVFRYGEYAPSTQWNSIRASLDLLKNRIRDFPSWTGYLETYSSGFVSVSFWSYHHLDRTLSATDAATLITTTKNLFFAYNDHPRAFSAEITLRQRPSMFYNLQWRPKAAAWPERLPFIPHRTQKPDIYIYLYGRDAEPSMVNQVRDSLRWIINAVDAEGPRSEFINRNSYSHNSVKLILQGPGSGSRMHVKRQDLIVVVDAIYELYVDNGPREFAAQLLGARSILGKIFLLFTDLDSGRTAAAIHTPIEKLWREGAIGHSAIMSM